MGMSISTGFGTYILDEKLIDWILSNVKESMFNRNRSYVYNKAMHEFSTSSDQASDQASEQVKPNVYDLIRDWAETKGIYDSGDIKTQYIKLQEESGELAKAILDNDREEFIDAIGDMVVVLTNLAALEGLLIEDCITSAYNVIKSRKGKMQNGTFVKESNLTKSTL